MSFRDVPKKRRLVLLVPDDVYQRVRDIERAHDHTSLSEIGATALAQAFGMAPCWEDRPELTQAPVAAHAAVDIGADDGPSE